MFEISFDLRTPPLYRESHISFVLSGTKPLSSAFARMDALRTWQCYWTIHALRLLNYDVSSDLKKRYLRSLNNCLCPKNAGFGGGFQQNFQTASTYAAVCAIFDLGSGFELIDRNAIEKALLEVKLPNGSFKTSLDGEADIRATYAAIAVASMIGLLDNKGASHREELINKTYDYVLKCQTYEGGFGGEPGNEAHGGYTFCALAILIILEREIPNLNKVKRWILRMQSHTEGGLRGRTNKLVDACYSFWVGVTPYMLNCPHLLDYSKLNQYLMKACQDLETGGLKDKPGTSSDYYHTCYALSGLYLERIDPKYNISKKALKYGRTILFSESRAPIFEYEIFNRSSWDHL